MGRRPNQRQRANERLADTRAAVTALPADIESRRRVPLAGYEELYEITRTGHVYSKKSHQFIKWAYYNGPYIKLQVNGETVTLNIDEAREASWENAANLLYRIEVPATTLVVLARDERQAREIMLDALRTLVKDQELGETLTVVTSLDDVPEDWRGAVPYSVAGGNHEYRSIPELLAGGGNDGPAE